MWPRLLLRLPAMPSAALPSLFRGAIVDEQRKESDWPCPESRAHAEPISARRIRSCDFNMAACCQYTQANGNLGLGCGGRSEPGCPRRGCLLLRRSPRASVVLNPTLCAKHPGRVSLGHCQVAEYPGDRHRGLDPGRGNEAVWGARSGP